MVQRRTSSRERQLDSTKMAAVPEVEYHDYANMLPVQGGAVDGEKNGQNFPVRLHYMLNELEKEGNDDIASFAPHGRCFSVHKQDRFVNEILGRYVARCM